MSRQVPERERNFLMRSFRSFSSPKKPNSVVCCLFAFCLNTFMSKQ